MSLNRRLGLLLVTAALGLSGAPAPAQAGPPSNHPRSLEICKVVKAQWLLSDPTWVRVEPATGRKYRGGESVVVWYVHNYVRSGRSSCHFIIRAGEILHGPHVKLNVTDDPTLQG